MKIAKLMKETEIYIYKDENGEIIKEITLEQKLMFSIFKPEFCIKEITKEVIDSWNYKTKKEVDKKYWKFIFDNNLDSKDYYIVFI